MWWLLYIFVGAILLSIFVNKPIPKIVTKSGDVTIDTMVVQCENVPQGTESKVLTNSSEIIVTSNGFEKKIPHENIVDISMGLADQISTGSQFSVGKAVVGTAILGGIGAIGGFSGKHNYTPRTMIVSFTENSETNYMVFLQKIPESGKAVDLKLYGNLLKVACEKMNHLIKSKN